MKPEIFKAEIESGEHSLITYGIRRARCSCKQWTYIGILPDKRSLNTLFKYHVYESGVKRSVE